MKKRTILYFALLLAVPIAGIQFPTSAFTGACTLTIHKYSFVGMKDAGLTKSVNESEYIPNGSVPLAGVEFTVWKVDTDAAGNISSASDAAIYLLSATKQTGNTGMGGMVKFSLVNGLYYVAETGDGGNNGVIPTEPFLVFVPVPDPTGTCRITDIYIYSKSQYMTITKEAMFYNFETCNE